LRRWGTAVDDQAVSPLPAPPQIAESRETAQKARNAIGQLNETLRDVVVLRLLEGLSPGETAEVLGISIQAVDVRLSRGRAELKRTLAGVLDFTNE
jgi:RNA polymerase sigma-70 factor (ECF subfamily)